ncbi:hypothetical protein [Micromonospora sp. NPDC005707]|uniref:hypothetical protein n=1 Tax=Micromonospora sp. NPDC005707 TaxID=3157050 RepID=UPI0033E88974
MKALRRGWLWPRVVVTVWAATALLFVGGAPAVASTGVGSYPWQYNCSGYYVGPPTSTYAIHFGTGPTLGWLKIHYSSGCQTTWGHFASADTNKWTINASVWHPGQPSQEEWTELSPVWYDTRMLGTSRGQETCIGAQVYVRNGPWIGWYFAGCWTQ